MKQQRIKIAAYTLIAVMLAGLLCGCGSGSSSSGDSSAEGMYQGVSMSYAGFDMDLEDGEETYIELKSGGKGKISFEGTTSSLKWKLEEDGTLTTTIEGDDYYGSINDGTLTVDIMDIIYTFEGVDGAGKGIGGSGGSAGSDSSSSSQGLSGSVLDRLRSLEKGEEPYGIEDGYYEYE